MLADQSQPLRRGDAAHSIVGRGTSGPCSGHKEGPQGRNGSVNPLALRQRPTVTLTLTQSMGGTEVREGERSENTQLERVMRKNQREPNYYCIWTFICVHV